MFFDVPLPGLELPDRLDRELISAKTIARFNSRIVKTSSCWLWVGGISSPDGYGRINFTIEGKPKTISAHRFAALLAFNHLPDNSVVEHFCNEPLCVRVGAGHVHVSTQAKNLQHAVRCGRAQGTKLIVDSRLRLERSKKVRELAQSGFDEQEYKKIVSHFLPARSPREKHYHHDSTLF